MMRNEQIFLDNNATTPVAPEVVKAMTEVLGNQFGNPSSPYALGKAAAQLVEEARANVAALIGATRPQEVLFTSGATESNWTAFHSATQLLPDRRHLVITTVEHACVLAIAREFEERGYEVTRLPVDGEGRLDPEDFRRSLREGETALASIMWANNETGAIFPIRELAKIAREKGVPFHTDAAQATGKVPVDFAGCDVAMMSLCAHKFHGPKGVGALVINRRMRFHPLFAGSQEEGRRGGTLNVASIVGLGHAARLAQEEMAERPEAIRSVRDHFERGLAEIVPSARITCTGTERLPNTAHVHFPGIEGEGLLMVLDPLGFSVSTGSACSTGSPKPSHVLTAMGFTPTTARECLRFSFSRFNTIAQVDALLAALPGALEKMQPRGVGQR